MANSMHAAQFSVEQLFAQDNSDDDDADAAKRTICDASNNCNSGLKDESDSYDERQHLFPFDLTLTIREFSFHRCNANLLWPGSVFFASWLMEHIDLINGRKILEIGSGTGALAIFLRKQLSCDITTCDYNDAAIEDNIRHNCVANGISPLPHVRYTWGDPFPAELLLQPWDLLLASDILLYVKQYPQLVRTIVTLLQSASENHQRPPTLTASPSLSTAACPPVIRPTGAPSLSSDACAAESRPTGSLSPSTDASAAQRSSPSDAPVMLPSANDSPAASSAAFSPPAEAPAVSSPHASGAGQLGQVSHGMGRVASGVLQLGAHMRDRATSDPQPPAAGEQPARGTTSKVSPAARHAAAPAGTDTAEAPLGGRSGRRQDTGALARIPSSRPFMLMSWRRRIPQKEDAEFFRLCRKEGLVAEHCGSRVYAIYLQNPEP